MKRGWYWLRLVDQGAQSMPNQEKMRKRERNVMVTELEADEELREHSAFFGAFFESEMLRDGGEVSAAFSRQNRAVVCGSP